MLVLISATYTLNGDTVKRTKVVPGIPFCLQNFLNSLWRRFKKVPEMSL